MSSDKRPFSESDYFKVSVKEIPVAVPLAGALYLYLARNDRLIMRFQVGQIVTPEQLRFYEVNHIDSLWCPNEFKQAWKSMPAAAPAAAVNHDDDFDDSDQASSDEAAVAIDVLTSTEAESPQRSEALLEITSDVLSLLGQIDSGTKEDAAQAVERVRDFGNDVIRSIAKRHPMKSLHDELSLIKGEDMAHAQAVSSFCMIFAMGIGVTDVKTLGDLAFAALLHDIGLVTINDISLMMTPELKFTDEQARLYHSHVRAGLKLIKDRDLKISDDVYKMIEQHHEAYDGSGYPGKVSGEAFLKTSQILALCDRIDDYMSGRVDGTKHGAADSIHFIVRQESGGSTRRLFSPDFFKDIQKFIRRTTVETEITPKKQKAG